MPEEEDYVQKQTRAYQEGVDPNLVIYQLNIDEIKEDIRAKLEKFQASEELIDQILSVVESAANRNTYLSNFNNEDVRIISYEMHQSVIDSLFQYGDNLSFSQKNAILAAVGGYIFAALRRPMNQGERVFLSKTSEFKQVSGDKKEKKPETFGGLFKNWRKK